MIPSADGAGRPGGRAAARPVDGRSRGAARASARVRAADGADRDRAVRAGEGRARSGRAGPRRRKGVLRDVAAGSSSTPKPPNSQPQLQPLSNSTPRDQRRPLRPPLRRLVESHLPLQPRLRALLSRRRRHAARRHRELRRSERARHRGVLRRHRRDRRVRAGVPDDPDRRRAAPPARHPRDRPARRGARPLGRRRHQRRAHHARTWRGAWRRPAHAGCRCRSTRSIPIDTTASGRCAAPGGTRWRERRSSTGPGLPFIVQTTAGSHNLGELEAIADFAHDRLAARVWNLYFLVPTGRGQFVSDMTPAQYDEVLASLYRIQRKYDRRMLVNAKCAPHYIKTVLRAGRASRREPFRRSGPTPAAPAAARRGRTTWGSGRTATSRRAPTCRSSRGTFAARLSRTSGRPRSCSPTSAAARRSAAGAARAR